MKSGNTRGVIVLINEHLKLFTLFFHITQVKTSFENCSGSSYILREHQFRQLFDCILKLYRLFFHVQKPSFGNYLGCFFMLEKETFREVFRLFLCQGKSVFGNCSGCSFILVEEQLQKSLFAQLATVINCDVFVSVDLGCLSRI